MDVAGEIMQGPATELRTARLRRPMEGRAQMKWGFFLVNEGHSSKLSRLNQNQKIQNKYKKRKKKKKKKKKKILCE